MRPPDRLLGFTLAALALIVIPGPSVLFTVSRALAHGRRVAVTTAIGGAIGSFTAAIAVAAGVGAVVQTSAAAHTSIKLIGAAYLVYLGIQAIRHRATLREAFAAEAGLGGRRTVTQGFIVGVTNPKSVVFFTAILPQFVDPAAGPASAQMVVLGGVFAAIAVVMDSLWGVAAGAVRSWFGRSQNRLDMLGGGAV